MVFLGGTGHPAKYKPPTIVCATAVSGIYYGGPSCLHDNYLPVNTADVTGHSEFHNVTHTILSPSVTGLYRFEKRYLSHMMNYSCFSDAQYCVAMA